MSIEHGAHFLVVIEIDPHDPNKTKMILLQHGSPGGKVSRMVMNAGVNVVAPIESFKLCHRISTNARAFSAKVNFDTIANSSSDRQELLLQVLVSGLLILEMLIRILELKIYLERIHSKIMRNSKMTSRIHRLRKMFIE